MRTERWTAMRAIGALVFFVLIGGCANWNAVYRTKTIGANGPRVITIDAKQREVMMVREPLIQREVKKGESKLYSNPDNVGGWRVCAEASPDVFSTLSASASGALKADVKGQSGEARAAFAIAEAVGTIERTQTINLLRESMYRTCERYMSGAIGRDAVVVQAGRDWKAMIAILAIEQLTRAATPPATILVAGSTAAAVRDASDIAKQIVDAAKEEEVAQQAVTAAKVKAGTCPAPVGADAGAADKCADLSLAEERYKQKAATLAALRGAAGQGAVGGADASTGEGEIRPGGGRSTHATLPYEVTGAVREIAMAALASDDMRPFCIEKLEHLEQELRKACLTLLATAAKAETSQFTQLYDNALIRSEADTDLQRRRTAMQALANLIEGAPTKFEKIVAELRRTDSTFCLGRDVSQCASDLRGRDYIGRTATEMESKLARAQTTEGVKQ